MKNKRPTNSELKKAIIAEQQRKYYAEQRALAAGDIDRPGCPYPWIDESNFGDYFTP